MRALVSIGSAGLAGLVLLACSPAMQVRTVTALEAEGCERLGSFRAAEVVHYGNIHPLVFQVRRKAQVKAWEMGANSMHTEDEGIIPATGHWIVYYQGEALKCPF